MALQKRLRLMSLKLLQFPAKLAEWERLNAAVTLRFAKESLMDWITSRIKEPTTWLSVGMGALVFSVLIPKWAIVLVLVAAVTALAGIVMKEKGVL
jgi:hypothetical protein